MTTNQHPPIETLTNTALGTVAAAFYLGRKPQTLRKWACQGRGPVTPLQIYGRLAWPVSQIRELLGVAA